MAQVEQTTMRSPLDLALEAIGPVDHQVVRLDPSDGITSENFEYADLLRGGRLGRRVGAVIEKDGSPLVYLADAAADAQETGQPLAHLLANRGETAVLLDVHCTPIDGRVFGRVWPCTLDASKPRTVDLTDSLDARGVLGDLQHGLWGIDGTYQEQRLRDLLVDSVAKVSAAFLRATYEAEKSGGDGHEVLALVGRALFTRFLIDRGILSQDTAPALWRHLGHDGSAAFGSPEQAAATCQWLDLTFNGEFLPLPAPKGYQKYFADLCDEAPEALRPLSWIVGRTDAGGQLPLWDKLDFSYIPAGTLSEVYEDYAQRKAPRDAKAKSVHFTPRHIARMMVRQALAGLPEASAANAKILDPAVGAAVFLSLAYRELARLSALQNDGIWPDTKMLRHILYKQLRGFDINSSALNLAALALYLTAIELDANPVPPENLKFANPLVGTVLLNVGTDAPGDTNAAEMGSLRRDLVVGEKYDIVIGNPPWTSVGRKAASDEDELDDAATASNAFEKEAVAVATRCLERRSVGIQQKYAHPDKVPDVAFLWKATEWAREGGIISMVVHHRLLAKRSSNWTTARRALFSCIKVDGILNAGEFANHHKLIWPGIESPFCILFARNELPPEGHCTQMLTLAVEPPLLSRRQIRLDPLATMKVASADFDERPGGIVARTKGCELDRALLLRWADRMKPLKAPPIRATDPRRLPLTTIASCIAEFASRPPRRGIKNGKKGAKLPAWLHDVSAGARELAARGIGRVAGAICATDIVDKFSPRPIKSSPGLEWFRPPFLLLRQSLGDLREGARAVLVTPSDDAKLVMFPFAFLGMPLNQGAEALLYAKYVAVWVNSSLYSYYQTLTSTQFALGIKALLSEEIVDAPIMDLHVARNAGLTDQREIEDLFDGLADQATRLEDIDAWVYKIVQADASERSLIEDTLSVAYPIGPSRHSGKHWVTPSNIDRYLSQLKEELHDVADFIDIDSLRVVSTGTALSGWRFVSWKLKPNMSHPSGDAQLDVIDDDALVRIVRDKYPEGQIWATARDGQFVFGQIALSRLWLPSRACLAAQLMTAWADQCRF